MKKTNVVVVSMLVLATLAFLVSGSEVHEVGTLDYQETDIVAIPGNITLVFNHSDRGPNDIILLWRMYSAENNITLYSFMSKKITYDHTFENDTKGYYFFNDGTNETYVIFVDYSIIAVPTCLSDLLNQTIVEMNATIAELMAENVNFSKRLANMSKLLQSKNFTITVIQDDLSNAQAQNKPLQNQIQELTDELDDQKNTTIGLNIEINDLESTLNNRETTLYYYEQTINQLADPWCTAYGMYNEHFGNVVQHLYFNITYFLIGGIVFAVIALISIWKLGFLGKKHPSKTLSPVDKEKKEVFDSPMDDFFKEVDDLPEPKPARQPLTSSPRPASASLDWRPILDMPDEKSWGYNGGETVPITAKKNDGVWEVFVDGRKKQYFIPSEEKLENVVDFLQESYEPVAKPVDYNAIDNLLAKNGD